MTRQRQHIPDRDLRNASTTSGLPVAPSLGPALAAIQVSAEKRPVDRRVLWICVLAVILALAAGLVARALVLLIDVITNIAFYGRLSFDSSSPAGHPLGAWMILVPVAGGLIVGLMARYGSRAIRGHGIPEAMEQVLTNHSRVPPRITFLKPLSSAIVIGTGGPFGAEGPIIATGGALGSFLGQLLRTTADERKTLLAAGAAAGMAATFGSPVSAVLLAVELLLFEFRPRSIIPVALACVVATATHIAFVGGDPVFGMPDLAQPGPGALAVYTLIGALIGVAAVVATRIVYRIEDGFERIPIHWMWWPALGAIVVGVVGLISPRTLGVGYDNIEDLLSGRFTLTAMATLCLWKMVSWSVSLGSGTSGGTLAPLFTIGGGLGGLLGAAAAALLPAAGVDLRLAALVGMAAMFSGASRAVLASIVFAFETTRQPLGLLPLLGGCTAAYLISYFGMRHSIMTERIARRGVRVVSEYEADFLAQVTVAQAATKQVETLSADEPLIEARDMLESVHELVPHNGFPVTDRDGALVGIVTRRELMAGEARGAVRDRVRRPPVVTFPDSSLREAADQMVLENIGRLPVVDRANPTRVVGILTRSDLLCAHSSRLRAGAVAETSLQVPTLRDLRNWSRQPRGPLQRMGLATEPAGDDVGSEVDAGDKAAGPR